MSDAPRMSAELRQEVERSICPVKPCLAPWQRLLFLAPVLLGVLAMPFVYFRVRDLSDFGLMLSWVPVALQLVLAFALLAMALRESIPGWQVASSAVFGLVLLAYGLQIIVNLLIFMQTPLEGGGTASVGMWMGCFRIEALMGIPLLVLIAWLVSRALPQRPLLAGFLAGSGAGFAAEASWRMICANSHPGHVLMGHTAGILALGVTGGLLGYLWTRLRLPPAAAD